MLLLGVNSDQHGNFPQVRKHIYAEGYYGFVSFASLFDLVMRGLQCLFVLNSDFGCSVHV